VIKKSNVTHGLKTPTKDTGNFYLHHKKPSNRGYRQSWMIQPVTAIQ